MSEKPLGQIYCPRSLSDRFIVPEASRTDFVMMVTMEKIEFYEDDDYYEEDDDDEENGEFAKRLRNRR